MKVVVVGFTKLCVTVPLASVAVTVMVAVLANPPLEVLPKKLPPTPRTAAEKALKLMALSLLFVLNHGSADDPAAKKFVSGLDELAV